MHRIGFIVGAFSLILAIGNLALYYLMVFHWGSGFPLLFLGLMAFCGAWISYSHGSWRIASVVGFLAICGSILTATARLPYSSWQLVLLCGAVAAGPLLGWLLWANYRKDRNLEKRPRLSGWITRTQRHSGLLMGVTGLTLAIIVWLQFDLASCSIYSGHLAERFSSTRYANAFLAPAAFLAGAGAIGCGNWRLGALGTYVSLGALVAVTHATGDPISRELALLAAPLSLFFYPLLTAPLHPLYNPWISAILAAILFVTWRARNSRQAD